MTPDQLRTRSARRRIQALAALGWSPVEVAQRAGLHPTTMQRLLNLSRPCTPEVLAQLDAVYRRLEHTRPTPTTMAARVSVTKTLTRARQHRWRPPAAWDDIDLDPRPPLQSKEPVGVDELAITLVVDDGHHLPLNLEETRIAITRLNNRGIPDQDIAIRLGRTVAAVTQQRSRLGLPEHFYSSYAADRTALGTLATTRHRGRTQEATA